MEKLKSGIEWLKSNWAVCLLAFSVSFYAWYQTRKIEWVTHQMTKELTISRSMDHSADKKAIYMPGSNCVIRATPDVSKQLFMDLAMACARKHEEYLVTLNQNILDKPQ